ncbi:MAG: sulfotransferase [Phycisphaeraceae bacterium]|nr:sulfotransferase [Phycisphaeraceae bacterium]
MQYFHVNASLPRSGSELMQALLSQHPEVYASATSPLLEYWYGAYGNYNLAERKSQNEQTMRRAFLGFCNEGTKGYYEALTSRPVIVDKSRGWLEYAELLWEVYPDARIVCMTRKVADIVASLERIYRANPGHPETRHLPKTAEQRAQYWTTSGNLPLGLALDRLRDRQARGPDARIRYVDYDHLVDEPVKVMRSVFEHLQIDPLDIDPMNVRKSVPEDDTHYGIFGRHQLRQEVVRHNGKMSTSVGVQSPPLERNLQHGSSRTDDASTYRC